MPDRCILAAVVGLVLPTIAQVWLIAVMHRYRVDIDPRTTWLGGGPSFSWHVNVLRPSNYSAPGKRLLPWLVLCQLTQVGSFILLVECLWSRR